jgi:hypothetical protein
MSGPCAQHKVRVSNAVARGEGDGPVRANLPSFANIDTDILGPIECREACFVCEFDIILLGAERRQKHAVFVGMSAKLPSLFNHQEQRGPGYLLWA